MVRRGSQIRFRSLTRDGQELLKELEQVLEVMRETAAESSVV